jgi:hypothetical protein
MAETEKEDSLTPQDEVDYVLWRLHLDFEDLLEKNFYVADRFVKDCQELLKKVRSC